jgi:hypothetical protein
VLAAILINSKNLSATKSRRKETVAVESIGEEGSDAYAPGRHSI